MEDLFVNQFRNARIFETAILGPQTSAGIPIRGVASSSKYGLTFVLGPGNKIFSCNNIGIKNISEATDSIRLIDYYDQQSEISCIDVSTDSTILAVCLNKVNGVFIELFDVQCFDVKSTKEIFPLTKICLSTNSNAKLVCFQWNPCNEPYSFAASLSDKTLAVITYDIQNPSSFGIMGNQQCKSQVTCISWSPKGKQLTVGDTEGRIHQLKPDLGLVRIIESPKNVVGCNPNEPLSCADISWLTTTEWLVGYSDLQKRRLFLSLLVVKKQQPPNWSFFPNAIQPNVNSNLDASLKLLSVLEWQIVIVCSSNSSKCTVIGYRQEQWCQFGCFIFLPLENETTGIFPIGCCMDLAQNVPVAIGDQHVPPQPVFNLLTATGWLISYHIISLGARPAIIKVPEAANYLNARFGNPPPNYKKKDLNLVEIDKATNSSPFNQIQKQQTQSFNISNNDPDKENKLEETKKKVELEAQQKAEEEERLKVEKEEKLRIEQEAKLRAEQEAKLRAEQEAKLRAEQEAKLRAEQEAKLKIEAEERAKKEAKEKAEAEEARKRELEALEKNYVDLVERYVKMRNQLTKKIDLLRELRGDVEHCFVNTKTMRENLSNLSEIVCDIQVSVDDTSFKLEKYEAKIFDSTNVLSQMKIIYEEATSNKAKCAELDFNQRKTLENIEERFFNTIDKFEEMKKLLEKVSLTETDEKKEKKRFLNQDEYDWNEQKKISNTTKHIGNMIVKISARINFLQKQLNQLKALSQTNKNNDTSEINLKENKRVYLNKIMELERIRELSDQCATHLNNRLLLISEETKDEARALWKIVALGVNNANYKKNVKMQLNLIELLKKKETPKLKKIKPEMMLSDTILSSPFEEKLNNSKLDHVIQQKLTKNAAMTQKPRLVSVATQSPNLTDHSINSMIKPNLQNESKLSSTPICALKSKKNLNTTIVSPNLTTSVSSNSPSNAALSLPNSNSVVKTSLSDITTKATTSIITVNAASLTTVKTDQINSTSKTVASNMFKTSSAFNTQSVTSISTPNVSNSQVVTSISTPTFSFKPTVASTPLNTKADLNSSVFGATTSASTTSVVVTTQSTQDVKDSVSTSTTTAIPSTTTSVTSTAATQSSLTTTSVPNLLFKPVEKEKLDTKTKPVFQFKFNVNNAVSTSTALPVNNSVTPSFVYKPMFAVTCSITNANPSPSIIQSSTTAPNFSFKPPFNAVNKQEQSLSTSLFGNSNQQQPDVQMNSAITLDTDMDEGTNVSASNAINFNFNKTGLGSSFNPTANTTPKNPFGGSFLTNKPTATNLLFNNESAQTPQSSNFFDKTANAGSNNNSLFNNSSSVSSGFGQNAFGASAFSATKKSPFSGSAFGGSAFGKGAFETSSFQTNNTSPFGAPQVSSGVKQTTGGFSAFANKPVNFGQFGNSMSPISQQPISGGTSMFGSNFSSFNNNVSGMGNSPFGGNLFDNNSPSSVSTTSKFAEKSSAFTKMRK